MRFEVLGPVGITSQDGCARRVRSRQQRLVLAALLLQVNQPVTVSRLIDLLWPAEPPRTARGILHNHISALRAILRAATDTAIRHEPDAYTMVCDPMRVDLFRFRGLLDSVPTELAARLETLNTALELVRGPALGGLGDDGVRDVLAADIDEDVALAREERAELLLSLRPAHLVLPEVLRLVGQHPDRPRLVAARMTCLQALGRDREALRVYDAFRTRLADGYGIDPPELLRALHLRILRGHPVLDDRLARTDSAHRHSARATA